MDTPFDLSHLEARTLLLAQVDAVDLVLVGTGGTGSFVAEQVARLARVLIDAGRSVRVRFYDDDVVEQVNVPRSKFTYGEVGLPKAAVLALRYNAAWGLEIEAILERFTGKNFALTGYQTLTLLIGCVDGAQGRRALGSILERNADTANAPRYWYLDCGNFFDAGQVLLGSSSANDRYLSQAFRVPGICARLPSPLLQSPDLLVPRPDETATQQMSCAEMAAANAQSLTINQAIATVATDYLLRLLLTHDLKRFATMINMSAGSMRSRYITPDAVAQGFDQSPDFFVLPPSSSTTV